MTDHIARVREQAEREAVCVFGKQREADLLPADYYQAGQMSGYIMGQIALASRLTREMIAEVLNTHHHIAATPGPHRCTCGVELDGWVESHRSHQADTILALLAYDTQS